MVADESALILVSPNDTIDAIITKVRTSGATNVQLLVPDGPSTLQDPHNVEQLRQSAEFDAIDLLVISSDEQTLTAVQGGQIEVVGVSGARVTLPDNIPGDNGGIDTHLEPFDMSAEEGDSAPSSPHALVSDSPDDDVFAALDELSDTMAKAPSRDAVQEEYDAFAAELDSWGDISSGQTHETRDNEYDVFAAELDNWGDAAADSDRTLDSDVPPRAAPTPRPRIRPEDIELTDEEKRRASSIRDDGRRMQRGYATPRRTTTFDDDDDLLGGAPQRRSQPWLRIALPLVLIILLIAIIFLLVFGNGSRDNAANSGPLGGLLGNTTVTVYAPVPITDEQMIESQPIPLIDPGAEVTDTAVQASPISVATEHRVTGQVQEETQAAASSAAGTLVLYNQNTQTIDIPQGTAFVGTNADGQEVRFTTDAPVTVGSATTARQGPQIITTLGEAQVNVTAVAPGSASNIAANTIFQMIIPEQAPIAVNQGALLAEHGPIEGGTEQAVWIVKDTDVQQVLSDALTGLDEQARQMLGEQAEGQGLSFAERTINPERNVILEDESYDIQVVPPIGETVDPTDPRFEVVVRATFDALATPAGTLLESQLQVVWPNQLAANNALPAGMAPRIIDIHWDGERLTVDGVLRPTATDATLDAGTRAEILEALRGKPRSEAQAALDNFIAEGVISSYDPLPDVETLPEWSPLLNLQVEPANVQAEE